MSRWLHIKLLHWKALQASQFMPLDRRSHMSAPQTQQGQKSECLQGPTWAAPDPPGGNKVFKGRARVDVNVTWTHAKSKKNNCGRRSYSLNFDSGKYFHAAQRRTSHWGFRNKQLSLPRDFPVPPSSPTRSCLSTGRKFDTGRHSGSQVHDIWWSHLRKPPKQFPTLHMPVMQGIRDSTLFSTLLLISDFRKLFHGRL